MQLKITTRERVIIFIVIALLLLFAVFYSARKGVFGIRPEKKFKIIADRSYGIKQASKVKIKDIEAGIVDKVYLDKKNQVVIIFRVNREFEDRIREDSVAKIVALPFIGVAHIEIEPGTPSAKTLKDGGIVKLEKERDIIKEFTDIAANINPAIKKLNGILDDIKIVSHDVKTGKGSLGKILKEEDLYNRFLTVADKTIEVVETIRPITSDIAVTIKELPKLTTNINKTLAEFRKLQRDFTQIADNLKQASASTKDILKDVKEGKGTLGRLIHDEEMHDKIVATVDNAKSILSKINRVEVQSGMNANYYSNQNLFVSKIYSKIHPTPAQDNYIQIGGAFLNYKKEEIEPELELLYSRRLSNNYSIKGGIIEGEPGLSVNYKLKPSLKFTLEGRGLTNKDYDENIDNFLLRSYIDLRRGNNLWLRIGLNNLLNDPHPQIGIVVGEE